MATLESGPPSRQIARVANPEMPESVMGWVRILTPTLTGTALGVIEGMAATGRFQKWAELGNGWKALIFGAIAGVARYLEDEVEDPDAKAALHDLYAAAWAFAVAYGVRGLIVTYLPTAGLDGLNVTDAERLAAIMDADAEKAEAAISELVDNRDAIAAEEVRFTGDADGVGELDVITGDFDLDGLVLEGEAY